MSIWIMALVLIGLLALIGYFQGAIQAAITMGGIILGALLALPLAPLVKPAFAWIKVTNTVWLWLWPPVLVFALVVIAIAVAAFFVHRQAAIYIKFHADDISRYNWERMNKRVGACVGSLSGGILLLLAGLAIYGPGYITVQFANEELDPAWLRFVNKARADLQATGLDKTVALLDPMPKKYYEVTDILGLLYHNNPGVLRHLAVYPPFLNLGERQELKDIAQDKDYMDALQGKASLVTIVNHPTTQALINNPEIVDELLKLDLEDFRTYLEQSKSPKFDPLKILGRWELDGDQVIVNAKKKKPDISATELKALKQHVASISGGTTLKATTDNKLELMTKGSVFDFSKASLAMLAAPIMSAPSGPPKLGAYGVSGLSSAVRQRFATAPTSVDPGAGMTPDMRRRYNLPMAPPPTAPVVVPEPVPVKLEVRTYQGTWEGDGDNYQFKLRDDKGKEEAVDAMIEGGQLQFTVFGQQFVFVRQF